MTNRTLAALGFALAWLAVALPARAADAPIADDVMPDHRVADPTAPAIDSGNLLASERFWPYTIDLREAWKPSIGKAAVPAGTRGVLIRVESAKHARVDFGRHGVFEVPIAETDLLERADQIRLGRAPKPLPNFVEAIGPRLVSSTADPMRPLPIGTVYPHDGFLCVFADPNTPAMRELARAIAPLARPDVMPIFFPQGRPSDAAVWEKLRALDWKPAFVLQHLSEPYTRTLLGDGVAPPAILLVSREGRLLSQEPWSASAPSRIARAIESAFGPAVGANPSTAAASRP
jgi:hypothetical protein